MNQSQQAIAYSDCLPVGPQAPFPSYEMQLASPSFGFGRSKRQMLTRLDIPASTVAVAFIPGT